MKPFCSVPAFAIVSGLLVMPAAPASPADSFPPPPVHAAEEQVELFRFAEAGYRIELVACEPMVQDPVAITFDGEGRLWVAEMRGYMLDIDGNGSKDPIGRISVLLDTNGDGRMDRSTVFAEGLVLPRSVAVHPRGVLIAENKTLTLHRDLDGDLVSDESEIVDPDYASDNIEHSANGLYRTIDNRIYNAKEGHGYEWTASGLKRFNTEARGQWGICQDDYGRLYYNYNHSPLHTDSAPPGSLTRNPTHEPTSGLAIGVTQSKNVFPIRPTPAANRGYIPHALDEEQRIKQNTSACAPHVYRGDLFEEFRGDAFVCEPVGNLIQRIDVIESGNSVSGSPAYSDRDFLASTDERFRPCWLTTGPDGSLYIADMYRGVVQDSPHMSPYLRQISMDREMVLPVHKGRIWRVVPDDFNPTPKPKISEMTTDNLVESLGNENGWWRDQAQMSLVEGNHRAALPSLIELVRSHENPLTRLHALWTIEGMGHNDPDEILFALSDPHPQVCAAAIRVLLSLGLENDILAAEFESLSDATHLSEPVALQIVLSAGDLSIPDKRLFRILDQIVTPRQGNPLMRDAVLSSLTGKEGAFLRQLIPSEAPGFLVLAEALSRSATFGSAEQAEALLDHLAELSTTSPTANAIHTGLRMGAAASGKPPVLSKEPTVLAKYPDLANLFAWPGHRPNIEIKDRSSIRPLTPDESKQFARGRQIYLNSCVACHGNDGNGMKFVAPPLAGSNWVLGSEERLARILFHGLSGPITVSGKLYDTPEVQPVMPPLATLDNSDIAAVLSYVRREWGNDAEPISSKRISRLRIEAQGRTIPWTQAELEQFISRNSETSAEK